MAEGVVEKWVVAGFKLERSQVKRPVNKCKSEMTYRKRIQRVLNRFQILQNDVRFLDDENNYAIVMGRLFLSVPNLWPMNFHLARRIFFVLVVVISITHQITIAASFSSYVKDVHTSAHVLPSLALGIQLISKAAVLRSKANRLGELVKVVWKDFWLSNIMRKNLEYQIPKLSRRILTVFYTEISISAIYSIVPLILPFCRTPKILFHQAIYPFDLTGPLGYSIAFSVQSFMTLYVDTSANCGYDLVYEAICINYVAQFRLLCKAMECIGSGREKKIMDEIRQASDDKERCKERMLIGDDAIEKDLLLICIKHHQIIIGVCHELNEVFGAGAIMRDLDGYLHYILSYFTAVVAAMSFIETFRIQLNKKLWKNEPVAYEDEAKYVLGYSQIIAKIINLWPCDGGGFKTVFFFFMVITGVLQELSLILHLKTSKLDVDVLIKALASMMIIMQSMLKGCVFYYKSKDLNRIIGIIRKEFWPSNIMGESTRMDIKKYSKILMIVFIIQYISAVAFLSFYVILPVTKPGKQLPHTSWFPFDVAATPYYEIIFIWQAYLTVYINENIVCAYDTLYCAICGNCIAQFRLLNAALRYVGSGKEDEITKKLLQIPGVTYQGMGENHDEAEKRLLAICIKHHQKLIGISQQLNRIFGPGHLIQLFASVLGTCTACYRITTETNFEDLTFLIAFYIAHVSQLLEYCALSHELSYWGTTLSESTFESYWYLKDYCDIRKCISLVMMRSQKPISMNALGLFELNYRSFISIMRFTLSLYTFFSNMDN